jgi:uncharacterized protein (TIGR00369 family)
MTKPNPEYVTSLIELVNSSPFPQHLGMRLVSIELDRAKVALQVEDYHMQPFGMLHGGVVAALIDTATFWSAFLWLPEDAGLVNIDLKLNYLSQIVHGILTAEGHCLKAGRTISYAQASVKSEGGTLLAHGTSTLMALPGKGIALGKDKFL